MDDLTLLREMLDIYSPSYDEPLLSTYLVAEMGRRGFDAYQDSAGNAVARYGTGDPQLVLLGHIDTVPGFIEVCTCHGKLVTNPEGNNDAGRQYGNGQENPEYQLD